VVAGNNGPFGVQGALVKDSVPVGIPAGNVSYTAAVLNGGATSLVGTGTGNINDVVSLPVGATVTYTIRVRIPEDYTGNLVNTVTIDTPPNVVDTNLTNNIAILP